MHHLEVNINETAKQKFVFDKSKLEYIIYLTLTGADSSGLYSVSLATSSTAGVLPVCTENLARPRAGISARNNSCNVESSTTSNP